MKDKLLDLFLALLLIVIYELIGNYMTFHKIVMTKESINSIIDYVIFGVIFYLFYKLRSKK